MTAYITGIGESTTSLCVWSLERQGFKVIVDEKSDSLWEKLNRIYSHAKGDFLRVDADVIVNRNVKELMRQNKLWWYQALTFDWFQQDVTHGGIQFVREPALKDIRNEIHIARYAERPESYLYRLAAFHEPRRCGTFEMVCGLNGYKQADIKRIKDTKKRRGQSESYDFELAERIESL